MALSIDLHGHLALVTGSTGELGRVLANTLAKAGADLALHVRRESTAAQALQAKIQAQGRRAAIFPADIGDPGSIQHMRAAIAAALGAPSIVVINAVQQIHPWSSVLDESIEDYESQLRTCVLQSVGLAKAFVPAMIERGWGRVVGINSECAALCGPSQSAYVAGKRGMRCLAKVEIVRPVHC